MYDPPEDIRDTTHKKFEELLKIREEIFQIRNNFNIKVFNLRDKKLEIHEYINRKMKELMDIQQYLADDEKKFPETKVQIDEIREFPEKLLDLEYYSKKDVPESEQYKNKESTYIGGTMEPEEVQRIILQPTAMDEKYNFQGMIYCFFSFWVIF
jgi:cilia- and flagella-associated protein 44